MASPHRLHYFCQCLSLIWNICYQDEVNIPACSPRLRISDQREPSSNPCSSPNWLAMEIRWFSLGQRWLRGIGLPVDRSLLRYAQLTWARRCLLMDLGDPCETENDCDGDMWCRAGRCANPTGAGAQPNFPIPTGFPAQPGSGFPSGFPTGFPGGFPTGFPSGFPTQPSLPTGWPWGPGGSTGGSTPCVWEGHCLGTFSPSTKTRRLS